MCSKFISQTLFLLTCSALMLLIYLGILICIFTLNSIPYIFFFHSYLPVLKCFAAFTQPPTSPVQNQISSVELLFCHKAGNITHPNSKSGSVWAQVLASRLSLLHPTTSHTQFSRETFFPSFLLLLCSPWFQAQRLAQVQAFDGSLLALGIQPETDSCLLLTAFLPNFSRSSLPLHLTGIFLFHFSATEIFILFLFYYFNILSISFGI